MSEPETPAVPGLSVVCVFNDPVVRERCLDRSVAALAAAAAGPVELVAVDNTEHAYASAGAALNAGARRARHDVVVLVHQDVHLHSAERLEAAADVLRGDPGWGMLGACGVTAAGRVVGRLRDRVVLLGDSAPDPVEVDSLDEVLFMLRRADLLAEPLAEDADLAWHAYAVEYGVRLRERGARTGAMDLAITHNSLTVNLHRLAEAHAEVGRRWPQHLPVRTTCGVVGPTPVGRLRRVPVLREHGWRWQWLQESSLAGRAGRALGWPAGSVIADIRRDVDLLEVGGSGVLHVVNLDHGAGFAGPAGPLELLRRSQPVRVETVRTAGGAVTALAAIPDGDSVLLTDLLPSDVARLRAGLSERAQPVLIGVHDRGLWLLVGPAALARPEQWRTPRARPVRLGPASVGAVRLGR